MSINKSPSIAMEGYLISVMCTMRKVFSQNSQSSRYLTKVLDK